MKLKKFMYFYPEKPQLVLNDSRAMDDMSKDSNYIAELKYNGQRCELHMIDGKCHFWDRHGKALKYDKDPLHEKGRQDIIDILKSKFGKGYFIFDCELRHNKVTNIQNKMVIYDIHCYKNELLNRKPFWARRAILENYFDDSDTDTVRLISQFKHTDDFRSIFINACESNNDEIEGIVIKNLQGMLKLGRTSSADSQWMFKARKQTGRHRY